MHNLWVYIQFVTSASGSRALDLWPGGPGSNPAKVMGFFQPYLLCFVLCYGFHVVRLQTEILSTDTSDFLKQMIFLKSFISMFCISCHALSEVLKYVVVCKVYSFSTIILLGTFRVLTKFCGLLCQSYHFILY